MLLPNLFRMLGEQDPASTHAVLEREYSMAALGIVRNSNLSDVTSTSMWLFLS